MCSFQGAQGRGKTTGPKANKPSPKEIVMTTTMCEPAATLNFQSNDPAELNESAHGQLVREQVAEMLEGIEQLVLKHNVRLDLAGVERIDAGGIAALVGLYRSARSAGHRFQVTNASARVAGILAVVGLDGVLLSHNAVQDSHYGVCLQRPAA